MHSPPRFALAVLAAVAIAAGSAGPAAADAPNVQGQLLGGAQAAPARPRTTRPVPPAPAPAARSAELPTAEGSRCSAFRCPPRAHALGGVLVYAIAVTVAGAACVALLLLIAPAPDLGDWRLWLFGALVLFGELFPIDVPRREGLDRVTTSTAFGFAILLLFGPLPAVLAYGGGVADRRRRRAAGAAQDRSSTPPSTRSRSRPPPA